MLLESLDEGIRKSAVQEDEVLRASGAGTCARALAFSRRERPEMRPNLEVCARLGHALEAAVVEWLAEGGVTVEHRQREVWFPVTDSYRIAGHIDGTVTLPGGEVALLDIKGVGDGSFREWRKGGMLGTEFPNVRGWYAQLQAYMEGLRLDGVPVQHGVVLGINRSSGWAHEEVIPYDAAEVGKIRARFAQVLGDEGQCSAMLREHGLEQSALLPRACEWCDHKLACWGETEPVKVGRRDRQAVKTALLSF